MIFFSLIILCSSSGAIILAVSFWRSGGTSEGSMRISSGWLQFYQVEIAKISMWIYPNGSTSPTIDPWDTKCTPSNSRRMVSCEFSSVNSILAWTRRDKGRTSIKGITYMNCNQIPWFACTALYRKGFLLVQCHHQLIWSRPIPSWT